MGKRFFDLIVTILLLPIAAPVVLMCAVIVRATTPGPAFFTQERYGLNGTVFRIYKLRTLYEGTGDERLFVVSGDSRITPIGHFLRESRIDEWPQLINVLRGEMSLVGPRPHTRATTERALVRAPRYYDRLQVRPGIFGLTALQPNCYRFGPRNTLRIDRIYIRRQSLMLDLWIVCRSLFPSKRVLPRISLA